VKKNEKITELKLYMELVAIVRIHTKYTCALCGKNVFYVATYV